MLATRDYGRRWATNLIYSLKPDRWHVPPLGQWPGSWYGVMTLSEALLLSYSLEGTAEGGWAQWLYQHLGKYPPEAAYSVQPTIQDRFLFFNRKRSAIDYRATQPPFYFSDGGEAQMFWRSDWSDTADYAFVNAADAHYTAITAKHGGHIDLTRGSDYLLVAAGWWKGTGDGTAGTPENIAQNSAMQSTLYFWDGGSAAGGKCFDQNYNYDGCQLGFGIYRPPILRLTSRFAFTENEFATSYDYEQVPRKRTLQYFFRAFAALGDGVYVVWDRVQSTSDRHIKQLRWHLSAASTPEVSGSTIESTVGSSKIVIETLLPPSPVIRIVRNRTTDGSQPINWRAEITDPSPAARFNGLTVLFTAAKDGSLPAATLLATDSNHTGVQIAGTAPKVAIFPIGTIALGDETFNSETYSSVRFSSTHSGAGLYLIAGLKPGKYSVSKDGAAVSGLEAVAVGKDGVLDFASTGGAFSVSSDAPGDGAKIAIRK